MSIYGQYVKNTFDKLCDYNYINNTIKTDVNQLYTYLMTFEYHPPDKTDQVLSFINLFNLNKFPFISSILRQNPEQLNNKIGYNQYLIRQEAIGNTSKLLERVEVHDFLKFGFYVDNIKRNFESNFSYFQLLLNSMYDSSRAYFGYNRYYYDFLYNVEKKLPFEYVFNYRIFNTLNPTYINKSCFLFLILYNILRECIRGNGLTFSLMSYFDHNKDDISVEINTNFNNFLDNNLESFTNDFYTMTINNSLFFYNESSNFENHVKSVFRSFIDSSCRECFSNYLTANCMNMTRISNSIESIYSEIVAYTVLNRDIYPNVNLNYFTADVNYLLGFERYLYMQETVSFRDYYTSELEQLQYIILQNKDDGLFYINSQIFIHYLWLLYKYNMSDYESFELRDVSFTNDYDVFNLVLDKISIDNSSAEDVRQIITSELISNDAYKVAVQRALYDELMLMVSEFIDTDTIVNELILKLLPNMVTDIRSDFYLVTEEYKVVDIIRLFLQNFFYKSIVNGDLFEPLIDYIYDETVHLKDDITLKSDIVTQQLKRQYLLAPNYYDFFNTYFISVKLSEYINDFLAKFEVGG